ncbi:hypothetical protein DES40_1847 [Litorimonas taeanensis]|uniref:Uncharacterized protein n=1 Tax=Litorimonas taeanensis TaxID=568099 RepID=A0A420WDH3_9PROT|nr:DUF6498-containing protein [Litorimonas taeanensis]RKQ69067.1 hypothetical protein DES40_1847 [Litorimonas taeanensis]
MSVVGRQINFTPAIFFLVVMNLLPVLGVFLFGWDTGTLLLLYWLESIVIGILNIPKILSCQGDDENAAKQPPSLGGKLFLCVFFSVHYGVFSFGHYTFLDAFFNSIPPLSDLIAEIISAQGLAVSVIGLMVSHLFSMFRNFYGKAEYKMRSANTQMFIPYGRVFIMHIVIMFGGALVQAFGAPILALVLLVLLKTLIDIVSHSAEHNEFKLPS